jgi:hypothetical protein
LSNSHVEDDDISNGSSTHRKIQQAKFKLETLHQKHKLDIDTLAYKHGLNNLGIETLDSHFAKIKKESSHEHT